MFHVYRLTSGEFTGVCFDLHPRHPETLAANTPSGCGLFEGSKVDHEYQQVSLLDGSLIPRLPKKPEDTPLKSYRLLGGRWVPELTLYAKQLAKWETIKQARELAINAPLLETPFGVVNADPKSVQAISDTLAQWDEASSHGIAPATVHWVMADNTTRELSRSELGLVSALVMQRTKAAFDTASSLRLRIFDVDVTEEILEAVQW